MEKRRSNYIDLTGMVYNYFTVLNEVEPIFDKNNKIIRWNCRCVCGVEKIVRSSALKGGSIKSCGCMRKQLTINKIAEYIKSKPNGAFTRLYSSYRSDAKRRKIEFCVDKELFKNVVSANCFYCGVEPKYVQTNSSSAKNKVTFIYNGIDRIDSKDGYADNNIVTCCRRCNFAKGNMSMDDFFDLVKRIYEKSVVNKVV